MRQGTHCVKLTQSLADVMLRATALHAQESERLRKVFRRLMGMVQLYEESNFVTKRWQGEVFSIKEYTAASSDGDATHSVHVAPRRDAQTSHCGGGGAGSVSVLHKVLV